MPDLLDIIFRTVVIFLTLLVLMRLLGKRQMGELELSELDRAGDVAQDLLSRPEEFRETIQAVKEKEIYNLGHGAEAAGRYIVKRLGGHTAQ